MKKLANTLVGLAMLTLAGAAGAVPIQGAIAFGNAVGASWTPVDATLTTVTTTATADGVRFNANGSGDDGVVTTAFGDFVSTAGSGVNFNNFAFDPLTPGTTQWTFASGGLTYSLAMNTVQILGQNGAAISLSGSGTLSIAGAAPPFDPTTGAWTLTLNQNGPAFSFSSSAAPEPTIAALLGLGLLGFGATRRFRKAA